MSQERAALGGEVVEDFSRTSVQEAGVDDPDIVKTNGRNIFSVSADERLRAIDVLAPAPFPVGT